MPLPGAVPPPARCPLPGYGWPPGPPWQPARYSPLAIAALVTACLALFPLALALGIAALLTIPRNGERGRGMAIAAVAVASVEAVLIVTLVIIGVVAGDSDDSSGGPARERRTEQGAEQGAGAGRPGPAAGGTRARGPGRAAAGEDRPRPDARQVSLFDIEVGDCFDTSAGLPVSEEAVSEQTVGLLPCDTPHDAEAFGKFPVTGHVDYPGEETITRLAEEGCGKRDEEYPVDTDALPEEDVAIYFYFPEKSGWLLGDRDILCAYGLDEGKLRQPLGSGEPGSTAGHVTVRSQSDRVATQVAGRVGRGS
ncbi:septum formation family protein [Streptomyces pactum]|uniref:Septum formation family protein n=1 Tax=Streptomyces pactum TaxID=68249 RepID=A0ABS0NGU9_9ACTN|nr:septum formation family protein [Streptomyces pactum]MBH5334419.1 septum formation family protein [Streptomyces pactum]